LEFFSLELELAPLQGAAGRRRHEGGGQARLVDAKGARLTASLALTLPIRGQGHGETVVHPPADTET